jgi:CheY-like chemotaxis protein
MMFDNGLKLFDAVTKLVGVLVWPLVLVLVFVYFGSAIREFITSMGEFTLKFPGVEASGKRRLAEAAAALSAAVVSHPETGAGPEAIARDARAAAHAVAEIATPRMIRRAGRATVLWVDDRPSNNIHEREALEALGVTFVVTTSTDEALQKLRSQSFDVIISDMVRPPDSEAGYTLLDMLRKSGDQTPFIIYAGSRAPAHRAEARRRGAIGCTNRPNELFEMVLDALTRPSFVPNAANSPA